MSIVDNGDGGGAPAGDGGAAMAELPAEVLVEIKSKNEDGQAQLRRFVDACWRKTCLLYTSDAADE